MELLKWAGLVDFFPLFANFFHDLAPHVIEVVRWAGWVMGQKVVLLTDET
ncbi:hypothetical protein HanIR_Chr16g0817831 [Helianthus annuus]|nr:hypothetical protein HanIR_Chr16g0817831 [Helianthus annuus]